MSESRSTSPNDSVDPFNEPQRSRLLATASYMDKLLVDIEEIVSAPSSHAFPKYKNPLTPAQVRVLSDYIKRLRQQITHVLKDLDIALPEPKFDSTHSIRVILQFIEVAIEEVSPERLTGYGAVPGALSARLAGGLQEMKGIVRQMDSYLIQRPDADLSQRIAKLRDAGSLAGLLSLLTGIIDRHGLVEFRSQLSRILEKLERPTYEIAFFGRVSAGKSSLLNRIIGTDLLPTGVTPVTAVPTRICNRRKPGVLVWTGDGRVAEYEISRIADFVTEARNPGNHKRVTRVVAGLPLPNLPEEVVLVDTPGLGSLALEGAAETLAYLPQCDLGVVLVDASSNLHSDDVATLDALRSASIPGLVVLSKADLLSEKDIEQLADYTKRKIQEQLASEIDVSPLSSHPEMGRLLKRWIAEQIQPRIAHARRLAEESNQRKLTLLGERVLHALEIAAKKSTARPKSMARDSDFDLAETQLRESAALIEGTNHECFRMTDEIRNAASETVDVLASAAMSSWQAEPSQAELSSDWIRTNVNAVAQKKAQELAGTIQSAATALSQALNRAAEVTSLGDMAEFSSLDSLVKEMPPAEFSGCSIVLRRPRSLVVSVALARRSVISHLVSNCGTSLATFFDSYGRALELWFRNTLTTLDREFNSSAEVYRAQFQRMSAAGTEKPNGNALRADLAQLAEALGKEVLEEAESEALA